MIPYAKPAIILVAVASISAGSWMARGWFEDSKQLIAVTAQQALADEIRASQADIASLVEKRLREFRGSERVIDRGVIREIQTTTFKNVCIPSDSDSFRMLNNIAQGHSASKSDSKSAGDSTAADERDR
jgi:hypothetical protein